MTELRKKMLEELQRQVCHLFWGNRGSVRGVQFDAARVTSLTRQMGGDDTFGKNSTYHLGSAATWQPEAVGRITRVA